MFVCSCIELVIKSMLSLLFVKVIFILEEDRAILKLLFMLIETERVNYMCFLKLVNILTFILVKLSIQYCIIDMSQ